MANQPAIDSSRVNKPSNTNTRKDRLLHITREFLIRCLENVYRPSGINIVECGLRLQTLHYRD